jgi:hypothetical protein
MGPPRIESLDNDAMNGRVAGLVSRCWHRQGYRVDVGANEDQCGQTCGMDYHRAIVARTRCRLAQCRPRDRSRRLSGRCPRD